MENILLHLYFGIKFFHIYDNGLTNKLIQTLSQPHQKLSHLNINILPWNVPETLNPSLTRYIVEMDCHMRAKSLGFGTNLVLNTSQILIPKNGTDSIPQAIDRSLKRGQLIIGIIFSFKI